MNQFLFKHIDNSALVVFRIFFGLLCFLESVGSVFTGWITKTLVEPKFTFSFIGLEWLQPLPGNWMYIYYILMGIFGLGIMLGYKYKLSTLLFSVMWTGVYFMQKASYNNHYYYLMLLGFIMLSLPANRYASLDVKLNPKLKRISMPQWCKWLFVFQLLILYTYASIAKFYPDWLDLSMPKLLMESKKNIPIVGNLLQNNFTPYLIGYGGILYDGLIIPLLLIKQTRKYAFYASIFFHLFNSIVFQVGIFPFLSLAFCLFFFEPKTIQSIFLKKKPFYTDNEVIIPNHKSTIISIASIYFLIQVILPIRHHFITDNVLWTEEGHRMSWRMMLRSKSGIARYKVVNKATKKETQVQLTDYITKNQKNLVCTKPDVIWQFAQRLKKDYKRKGEDIAVYVDCKISVNGKPYQRLIDPNVDLASVKWQPFTHCNWILPSNTPKNEIK